MNHSTILVLFPTDEENQAAQNVFGGKGNGNLQSNLRERIVISGGISRSVCFASLNGQGDAVLGAAQRFIQETKPVMVILAGICGGRKDFDVGIGDVVISDRMVIAVRGKIRSDGTTVMQAHETVTYDPEKEVTLFSSRLLATTNLTDLMRQKLVDEVKPCFDDAQLLAAVRAAQDPNTLPSDEAMNNSVETLAAHFKLWGKSSPRFSSGRFFSGLTNFQNKDNPFQLANAFLDLCGCEMEGLVIRRAMRALGRTDEPLLIKVISDIPDFARSEKIKDFARLTAAHALKILLASNEFWRVVDATPRSSSFHRSPQQKSFEVYLEQSLTQNNPEPKVIELLSTAIDEGTLSAPAAADMLRHFAPYCKNCSWGAEKAKPFIGLAKACASKLSADPTEAVRSASLIGGLVLFPAASPVVVATYISDGILQALRNSNTVATREGAAGLVYYLAAQDAARALSIIETMKASETFSDDSLTFYRNMVFSAALMRGSTIAAIQARFSRAWNEAECHRSETKALTTQFERLLQLTAPIMALYHQSTPISSNDTEYAVHLSNGHENGTPLSPAVLFAATAAAIPMLSEQIVMERLLDSFSTLRRRGVHYVPIAPIEPAVAVALKHLTLVGYADTAQALNALLKEANPPFTNGPEDREIKHGCLAP